MKVQDMAQNLYSDTRGQSERPVTFTEAVIDGLAAGGGLYVPERIPELSLDEIGALAELPYAQRAARIYRAFDVDLPAETVEALMAQAYGDNFDDERICPITSLSADTHVLELLGVEPELAMIVTSTASSPFANTLDNSSNNAFIDLSDPPWKNIFDIVLAHPPSVPSPSPGNGPGNP